MRPARPLRAALAALAIVVAGCSNAALPVSSLLMTEIPTASPSAPASVPPSLTAEASPPSGASAPAATPAPTADATPAATPEATPRPTPKPTPKPASKPSGYQCTALLTDAEMRKATGLADAALIGHKNGRPRVAGETYCGFSASAGTVKLVVAVWTGGAMSSFNEFWGVIAGSSTSVPGIGDSAIIDAGDGAGGARVGKIGVSVQIKGPAGVPAGVNALSALTTMMKLAAKRV